MNANTAMAEQNELTSAQEIRWRVMACVTVIGVSLGAVKLNRFDFSDPVVTVIFLIAMLGIAYAERRWVKSNTDSEGRLER